MELPDSGSLADLALALSKAQAEMPTVAFDKQVSYKNINFWYATLSALIQATKPVLAKHGLTVLQLPMTSGNRVIVETVLLHASGQQIRTQIEAVMNGNDPKELGSCVTYLRRYSYASLLSLSSDSDTDAQIISERYLATSEQKVWLRDLLTGMGVTDQEIMRKVSTHMVAGNYEMTEDHLVKALETLRK
jgi:hypothetical protein